MARTKKYKINIFNLEVTSSCMDDFVELQNMLYKCAEYERLKKHLKNCETYEKMADDILCQLGGQ